MTKPPRAKRKLRSMAWFDSHDRDALIHCGAKVGRPSH
jgi:hypothetical protein